MAAVVVSYKDRDGNTEGAVCTSGQSVFEAAADALRFFSDPYWKGRKPTPDMILEVSSWTQRQDVSRSRWSRDEWRQRCTMEADSS